MQHPAPAPAPAPEPTEPTALELQAEVRACYARHRAAHPADPRTARQEAHDETGAWVALWTEVDRPALALAVDRQRLLCDFFGPDAAPPV